MAAGKRKALPGLFLSRKTRALTRVKDLGETQITHELQQGIARADLLAVEEGVG